MQHYSPLKQHFTDAKVINDLMCSLTGSVEGLDVLEPSVGHGAFLHGLLGKPSRVDAVDVDAAALTVVMSKFAGKLNVEAFEADFIDLFVKGVLGSSHPVRKRFYDAVISNPPYGLYLQPEYRKRIKRLFPDAYARESFGLFFSFAVSRLRDGGRYTFLMPDTFLSSVNHRPLRALMCSDAAPSYIVRFPSKLFETVNFGYGNLCIIAGYKRPLRPDDEVRWLDVFEAGSSLNFDDMKNARLISGTALKTSSHEGWSSALNTVEEKQSAGQWSTLGSLAECRTGIYTGDNERFIGYDAHRVNRRLNGHAIDWDKVRKTPPSHRETQNGVPGALHYVPLVRGGHREPFEATAWAIRWDEAAIAHYKTNRKARFQNSQFYFASGLSVPMVTSKRISAALMGGAVFDQGVVGVFPRDPTLVPALLLYLNSRYASVTMKQLVNGSANNSANYLKRLPVPTFDQAAVTRATEIIASSKRLGRLRDGICDEFAAGAGARLPD